MPSTSIEDAEPTAESKGARTKAAMLNAAIEILDGHGPDALTLQAVGEQLGLHRTSVYRHFQDRDDLIAQTLEHLIANVAAKLMLPDDPRGQVRAIALAMRQMFHRYPGAATFFVSTSGSRAGASQMELVVLHALRQLGVSEDELPVVYQALESYAVGTSLFDYAGAPDHLEDRRLRHKATGDPAMKAVTRSRAQIDNMNESAFLWGLDGLLDHITKSHAR